MLTDYAEYYSFISEYASDSNKLDELSNTKARTIAEVFTNEHIKPDTILSLGFGLVPVGLHNNGYNVTIGMCSAAAIDYGTATGLQDIMNSDTLDELVASGQTFDVVVACDDFMTYFTTEDEQRAVCAKMHALADQLIIITARDYKNLPQHARQFDEPLSFSYDTDREVVMFNKRKWSRDNKQLWDNYMYVISEENADILGPILRRTIYFKQLAKYMHDIGISTYTIQRNLLYKPLFAKHYEHIIAIKP